LILTSFSSALGEEKRGEEEEEEGKRGWRRKERGEGKGSGLEDKAVSSHTLKGLTHSL